ncbi:pentapeptide repeat-containing protein [Bradyrhizobium vignae]|uniref:pentapeptide repeat-containing protein n=1 Tax=Bradyrhizobium vignae TaxID=1549949 RepID=UPI003D31DA77
MAQGRSCAALTEVRSSLQSGPDLLSLLRILTLANLFRAKLGGASLTRAILNGADLRGADLSDAHQLLGVRAPILGEEQRAVRVHLIGVQ